MASHKRHKGKGGHHEEEHEEGERWLVSFADMMTLLFALFMVLFSISSVNTSKFEELQKSLHDAFSGAILSGGKSMLNSGSANTDNSKQSSVEPPLPSLTALRSVNETSSKDAAEEAAKAKQEEQDFQALKRRVDQLSKQAGLKGKVNVTVRRRGLVIQLLTDKVFFASGDASLKPEADRLVSKIGEVVRDERTHPVIVEGYTDSQPIANGRYRSNWDLSGARASAVVNDFAKIGVLAKRMTLQGYGSQVPIASNRTDAGREKNRRVEIVLSRLHNAPSDTESTP
jgi:chemotaxis protein MotB